MSRHNPDGSVDLSDFVGLSGLTLVDLLHLKQKPIDAVPTPLPAWNHRCRDFGGGVGLARGWHVTVGANTGNGKSVFSLNIAAEATDQGEKVGFLSLEMFWTQLATRYMAIKAGEPIDALEPGAKLDARLHQKVAARIDRMNEETGGEIFCNQRHISSLDDCEAAIGFLYEMKGCRLIIVDYMQLAKVVGVSDRLEAVTRISGLVSDMAKELQITTVGLSQFNRETSKDYENSPTPQGLMGGSPLENDSDQVLLIDHTKYQRSAMGNTAKQKFLLAKNRHGPTQEIDCIWDYSTLRVREEVPIWNGPTEDRGEAWEPEEPREPRLLA